MSRTGENAAGDRPPREVVVQLKPFDGTDGVDATPEELRIYRRGEVVGSVSGPRVEERAGLLDPYAGSPGFAWAAEVARHFPHAVFCYGEPVSFDLALRVGTRALDEDLAKAGTTVRALYVASPFESFDGELSFDRVLDAYNGRPAVGALDDPGPGAPRDGLRGSFRERRHDVASLSDYPEIRRRRVEVSLPRELCGLWGDEDLVLLYRVAVAVTELVRRYVLTGGEWISYEPPARVDNVFAGGGEEGPLPRRVAPALAGRSTDDVYRRTGLECPA